MYFHKYKTSVEVDEYVYCNRDTDHEKEREERLKEKLGFVFITINPHEVKFSINRSMNEIHGQIKRSYKELIEKRAQNFLIDDIKMGFIKLSLDFENNSENTRVFRNIF